jgi:1,2-diacylglycerol 3-beta-glucosyltransferase
MWKSVAVEPLRVLIRAIVAFDLAIAAYLLVLTIAAFAAKRSGSSAGPRRRHFAVLVPAHNEEVLIGRLLSSLHELTYSADKYDVCVVADNCDDATAQLARAGGAHVYERHDLEHKSKGFALRWLLEQLRADHKTYDAFIVLDADSVVAGNFLTCMDARLESGAQVVQAYYTVQNPNASAIAGLRYAALAAVHYLRPLGRSLFGLSCGLKGNGMCFAAAVLERFDWRWYTLAEDVEFHLALIDAGIRVEFAPETWVRADMPTSLSQASTQNARWEGGRWKLVRERVPNLIWQGVRQRSLLKIDAAVEQLIPPLSVPFASGVAALSGAVLLGMPRVALLAGASIVALAVYVLSALRLVAAPRTAYRSLLMAPAYIAWKGVLYVRAISGQQSDDWVRTARDSV